MTFQTFYSDETTHRCLADTAAHRALAAAAWDAALCAVQAAMFDAAGNIAPAGQIADAASALHTWALPLPTDH